MAFGPRSYFWRLSIAFLAVGLLPFSLLALLYGTASARLLENSYRDRTLEAVSGARDLADSLLREAAEKARFLSLSEPVVAYLSAQDDDPRLASEVYRIFTATGGALSWSLYVIPLDGRPAIAGAPLPTEYEYPLYEGWGILGLLGSQGAEPKEPAFWGQPHPDSGASVPVAAGVAVTLNGKPAGYVIVDVSRSLFAERVGAPSLARGTLTGLRVVDSSGCILYDMTDAASEAGFSDAGAVGNEIPAASLSASFPIRDGMVLSGTYPVSAARDGSERMAGVTLLLAGLCALAALAMALFLSRSIARPVHRLTVAMELVSQGRLDARCAETGLWETGDEIAILIHRFNQMIDRVKDLVKNLVTRERELRTAEVKALQAQMNPHFLYNTLSSIRSKARLEGQEEIAVMTTRLARILREGVRPRDDFSTLARALSLARDYFEIESFRWPGRFTYTETVDAAALDTRLPSLVVQPLVENALVHGLEPLQGEGRLTVHASVVSGDLILRVTDTGVGIPPDTLESLRARLAAASLSPEEDPPAAPDAAVSPKGGTGIALINTHRRICLIFGAPYGVSVESVPGKGTTVTVCVPREAES